ncbi:hypothetical protein COLO4_23649 [Corchorus olitorius]|uniref:Uncharacterized protein n=1 Tax=Corchorus olitorius TaxID=93759 RepID=A0A1R3IFI4_9ROSI|nr:hypothetical protein COLO4_23649 [Corchorus olitorius]
MKSHQSDIKDGMIDLMKNLKKAKALKSGGDELMSKIGADFKSDK